MHSAGQALVTCETAKIENRGVPNTVELISFAMTDFHSILGGKYAVRRILLLSVACLDQA